MMGGVDNKTERRVIDALRKSSPSQCKLVEVGELYMSNHVIKSHIMYVFFQIISISLCWVHAGGV